MLNADWNVALETTDHCLSIAAVDSMLLFQTRPGGMRTIPRPEGSTMGYHRSPWSILDVHEPCWIFMVHAGCSRSMWRYQRPHPVISMAHAGCSWSILDVYGPCWMFMVHVGCLWSMWRYQRPHPVISMNHVGSSWSMLDAQGPFGSS